MEDAHIHWTPSCIGTPVPHIKWRVLRHPEKTPQGLDWFEVECKHEDAEGWEGGLVGTQAWLGLTDEECERAYEKKVKKSKK